MIKKIDWSDGEALVWSTNPLEDALQYAKMYCMTHEIASNPAVFLTAQKTTHLDEEIMVKIPNAKPIFFRRYVDGNKYEISFA